MGLDFDGIDDAVALPNFDVGVGVDKLALMCWVRPDGSGDDRLISKADGEAVADHWWTLQMVTLRLASRLMTGGVTTQLGPSGSSFTLGEWAHAAMLYDGSTMRIYKNAVQLASTAKSGNVDRDATIGVRMADNPVGTRFYDGVMDDFRMYEGTIPTPAQLAEIVAAQGLDDILTGLTHRWRLNEEPAGVVASGAGSILDPIGGENGTPVSSPVYTGTILKSRRRLA